MKKHLHALATDSGTGFIEGGSGDDTLIGSDGRDTFVSRVGSGHDVVVGFNPDAGDRVLIDWYKSYSDIAYLGQLTDGLTITTATGGQIHISIVDYDHNGSLDTVISNDFGDSIAVLDHADLWGWALAGG